jgi:hypothetical protein
VADPAEVYRDEMRNKITTKKKRKKSRTSTHEWDLIESARGRALYNLPGGTTLLIYAEVVDA